MRRLLFCVLAAMLTSAASLHAANVLREVNKIIKNARYQEKNDEARKVSQQLADAEKKLLEAIPAEKKESRRATLYHTAAKVQMRYNTIENEKIYLKRAYDTAVYYNSIYKTYQYLFQCDSVERLAMGSRKPSHAKSSRKLLLYYRRNLLNACRHYMHTRNYSEAYRYLDLYVSSAHNSLLAADSLHVYDTAYVKAAYWATTSAYRIGNYQGVIRHAQDALRYPKHREYVQEYLCRSYQAINDTVGMVGALRRGATYYPDYYYFYTNLLAYYQQHTDYESALRCSQLMIDYDPRQLVFWYGKASTYLLMRDYKNCIRHADVALLIDSTHVESNFACGVAYCALARQENTRMKSCAVGSADYRRCRENMLSCYANARKPLETMRALCPDAVTRWAPLLYQVYLNLNMGHEFDEMDKLMRHAAIQ